jgi:hypothetical protein
VVKEIRIYIEGAGARDRNNSARLREGIRQFISSIWDQARRTRVTLQVIACGPRGEAYKLFLIAQREHLHAFNILLLDSEGPVRESPRRHLSETDGWDIQAVADEHVHFMAQAMEAWFIADPGALAAYYGNGFSANSLPNTQNVERIPKKDLVPALKRATRGTTKGEYHKTRHAFDLLARIDPDKVRRRAPHCARFFEVLHRHLTD